MILRICKEAAQRQRHFKIATNSDLATASGDYTPKAVALGQDDFLSANRGVSL